MAMTMKTTGLLLWADMHLHWADHVFKVSDREILEMLPCHWLLMLLLDRLPLQGVTISRSSIVHHQLISNPLVGTDAGRHRHIRELAADGAGMHMPVLGWYEGCGTKPGAHLRLCMPQQSNPLHPHSQQQPHISSATPDVFCSVHTVQVFPAPNNVPSFIGALHG